MELVEGKTLLEHANERALSVRQRVLLVAEIAEAVHYAHTRGVIHRDLKPENVLVDARGAPKVLDFGVARSEEGELALASTRSGAVIGTPAYMSPEQLEGRSAELDARTDVWSLGVVLFELLAGRSPWDVERASFAQVVRAVCESEPRRLAAVDRALRGDLDTIVRKALEKDRTRRYGSAAELALDLRRALAHEPVAARAPSATYQLAKLARRNPALVAALAALFLALVAGLVGTSRGLLAARAAEHVADERRIKAEAETDKALRIRRFLEGMLDSLRPEVARGADTHLVRRMCDQDEPSNTKSRRRLLTRHPLWRTPVFPELVGAVRGERDAQGEQGIGRINPP